MKVMHLAHLIPAQAKKYGQRAAVWTRNYATSKWESISWSQFDDKVQEAAQALVALDIKEQENVGVCSPNMQEMFFVDFALYQNRAVSVPMYATSSVSQIAYIVEDAEIRILFVGEQAQYDAAYEVMSTSKVLKHIIIYDPSVKLHKDDKSSVYFDKFLSMASKDPKGYSAIVAQRTAAASEEDMAAILYTSGTTGQSKGVMLMHYNFMEVIRIHVVRLVSASDADTSLTFLPLSHIFAKAWDYFSLFMGMQVYLNRVPTDVQMVLKEVRPTILCNVPRFWEKVYAGVELKIRSTKGIQKKMMIDAIKVGREHNLNYRRKGLKAPLLLRLKFNFYEKAIYSKLKRVLGFDKANFLPTAGAPLGNEINEFFQSLNLPLLYGYGLTETTATVSCFWKTGYEIGTVGEIMPDVQVKIGDNNEIMIKGRTVTPGYYKKPIENAASFEDGWFKTGDAGKLSEDGRHLSMTERIKDLYKTSNGKYIAPQAIETRMVLHDYIEQIAVIGDERKYVSALIVPDYGALKAYASERGILYKSMPQLLSSPKIYKMIEAGIEELQKDFASFERIKKFTLLAQPFSIERGELTNTLKLKRKVVAENYAMQIEAMYPETNE